MKREIIQEFKGTINGIEVNDKTTFWTSDWALDLIEDEFKIELHQKFIEDFIRCIHNIYEQEGVSVVADLENDIMDSVMESENMNDITTLEICPASYDIGHYYFLTLNQHIKEWNTYFVDNK
jgi:hypothetical protein